MASLSTICAETHGATRAVGDVRVQDAACYQREILKAVNSATFGFHTLVDTRYGREESWHRPASPLEGIAVKVAELGRGGQRARQRRSGGQRGEHWGQAVSVEVRARVVLCD
jgi:hypothetical protein